MIIHIAISALLFSAQVNAAPMEQCSYDQEYKGEKTRIVEDPSPADGSNMKRLAEVKKRQDANEEGYAGFRDTNITCRQLDDKEPVWHLFVQTNNGQVSLLHGLTENACYQALRLADNRFSICNNCLRLVQDSDFKRGGCFK